MAKKYPESLVRLRRALEGDLAYIGELSGRVFEVYGPYREMVARWFESRKAVTLVALMGERPVGFAMVGRFSDPSRIPLTAELLAIAVEPRRQKKGVGRMLMEGIEEISLPMNVGRLFLHTAVQNLTAQRLFARCGYRNTGVKSAFYPAGQDALLLTKDLPLILKYDPPL
ncbi:MAG: GNAT family N-acetyltransferase [Deltaproteobacteria bacterium]|nr:GNAT family N-acetyltransferase [Deltaproteobacteria bacterium]